MTELRKLIKWVLLIQLWFRQMFWVLWSKGKIWGKTFILYFWFDQLWPFNFQFGCRPKYSNHIIFVSAHSISKMKIVPKISWLIEFMVRNPFWDFKCYTLGNPCDSSPPPKDKIRPVTAEKFSKHGFSFFHQILPFSFESQSRWHFGCLI